MDDNNLPPNTIHNFAFRSYPSDELGIRADRAWSFFLPGSDGFAVAGEAGLTVNSIPAASHGVIQQFDNEVDAYTRVIDVAFAHGQKMVAIPVDTYNTQNFIDNLALHIHAHAARKNMYVLFRVDSGDVFDFALQLLQNHHLVIISEGLNFDNIQTMVAKFKNIHVSIRQRLYFGMGAGWWRDFSRDELGFAMKVGFANGKPRMKFSEDKIKRSLPGKLDLIRTDDNQLQVVPAPHNHSLYEEVYFMDNNDKLPYFNNFLNLEYAQQVFDKCTRKDQLHVLLDNNIVNLIGGIINLSPKAILQGKKI